jgi:UDP-hydrolysing UDP-N-acetyl-D-glucosamine 2-epimerase
VTADPPTTAGPRRIAVVTGTRAEYGLLEPLMHAVDAHPRLSLQCVVAGMHLVTQTHRDIAFPIAARVRMQKPAPAGPAAAETGVRVGRRHDAVALGNGVRNFAEAFAQLRPEVVVVLGDRIEAFAAASAASVGGWRVAHLHGGDRAEGVADEAMRHAISKLAHLHFPATEQSRLRLRRLGEHEAVLFNHGSPAADGLTDVEPDPAGPNLIVMHHPVGDADAAEAERMRAILEAVRWSARPGERVAVLSPNHDPGRAGIAAAIEQAQPGGWFTVADHLPRPRFLAWLKGCDAIVGNSSAGLIEAAILGTPCVNVGPRQAGRERPPNVVDAAAETVPAVREAIDAARARPRQDLPHPYGNGDTGPRIADTLATIEWVAVPLHKRNTF